MKDETRDKWELKRNEVIICEELGHGAFGKVCKGIMKAPLCMKTGQSVSNTSKTNSTITVAVKMLQGMLRWFLMSALSIITGPVHTTPERFENEGLTLKTHPMFSVYTTPVKFQNARIPGHVGFVFDVFSFWLTFLLRYAWSELRHSSINFQQYIEWLAIHDILNT